jgi:hypothetical protein
MRGWVATHSHVCMWNPHVYKHCCMPRTLFLPIIHSRVIVSLICHEEAVHFFSTPVDAFIYTLACFLIRMHALTLGIWSLFLCACIHACIHTRMYDTSTPTNSHTHQGGIEWVLSARLADRVQLVLPVHESEDEFKPFVRRLPEFKFWLCATRGITIAFIATFFEIFDIPVFWWV